MKMLKSVKATAEQLVIINDVKPGPLVVRGAAGSGKTTTALQRLRSTVGFWRRRHRDGYVEGPIQVLVVTYNKTLAGYVAALVAEFVPDEDDVEFEVVTFDKWAMRHAGWRPMLDSKAREDALANLGAALPMTSSFIADEVSYVLGRFTPDDIEDYIDCDRRGRGRAPAMQTLMRRRLLDEVVYPYISWKDTNDLADWSDLALTMQQQAPVDGGYHVVVVDESQDFSANQVRALLAHLHDDHSITFVLDGAQRIYPQRFAWSEVGLTIGPINSKLLPTNFRNTVEVAAFAAPLLSSVEFTDDSSVPNFETCSNHGAKPLLVRGTFTEQMDWLIEHLETLPAEDDIAIVHARGGGWFDTARERLAAADVDKVELTSNSDWPSGDVNIGLSTMHSVKGLEFDHVIVIGLNQKTMPHGAEGDSTRDAHLRLLAMAAGRARKTLTVTYKPSEASDLIDCMDASTYDTIDL